MVKIRCINPKSISIFNYKIKIYDKFGNLIECGYTKNNTYIFNNKKCNLYRLEVFNRYLYPYIVRLYFIPSSNIYIYFNNNSSTFYLTDKNYIGLPIERGELKLWQVPTI